LYSIDTVEKKWLTDVPELLVAPVLSKNISGVVLTCQMVHSNHLGGNGFTDAMEREGIKEFVEFGMLDSRTVHNDAAMVVSEYVAPVSQIEMPR
jgi:hypothetical protein